MGQVTNSAVSRGLGLESLGFAPTDQGAAEDVLQLNELLSRLGERDEQQARVVELRVFGGLTVEEAAEALDISPATVKRDWAMAKAWLTREIQRERKGEAGGVEQS